MSLQISSPPFVPIATPSKNTLAYAKEFLTTPRFAHYEISLADLFTYSSLPVFIYGSWARRHMGFGEKPPQDLDLCIIVPNISLQDLQESLNHLVKNEDQQEAFQFILQDHWHRNIHEHALILHLMQHKKLLPPQASHPQFEEVYTKLSSLFIAKTHTISIADDKAFTGSLDLSDRIDQISLRVGEWKVDFNCWYAPPRRVGLDTTHATGLLWDRGTLESVILPLASTFQPLQKGWYKTSLVKKEFTIEGTEDLERHINPRADKAPKHACRWIVLLSKNFQPLDTHQIVADFLWHIHRIITAHGPVVPDVWHDQFLRHTKEYLPPKGNLTLLIILYWLSTPQNKCNAKLQPFVPHAPFDEILSLVTASCIKQGVFAGQNIFSADQQEWFSRHITLICNTASDLNNLLKTTQTPFDLYAKRLINANDLKELPQPQPFTDEQILQAVTRSSSQAAFELTKTKLQETWEASWIAPLQAQLQAMPPQEQVIQASTLITLFPRQLKSETLKRWVDLSDLCSSIESLKPHINALFEKHAPQRHHRVEKAHEVAVEFTHSLNLWHYWCGIFKASSQMQELAIKQLTALLPLLDPMPAPPWDSILSSKNSAVLSNAEHFYKRDHRLNTPLEFLHRIANLWNPSTLQEIFSAETPSYITSLTRYSPEKLWCHILDMQEWKQCTKEQRLAWIVHLLQQWLKNKIPLDDAVKQLAEATPEKCAPFLVKTLPQLHHSQALIQEVALKTIDRFPKLPWGRTHKDVLEKAINDLMTAQPSTITLSRRIQQLEQYFSQSTPNIDLAVIKWLHLPDHQSLDALSIVPRIDLGKAHHRAFYIQIILKALQNNTPLCQEVFESLDRLPDRLDEFDKINKEDIEALSWIKALGCPKQLPNLTTGDRNETLPPIAIAVIDTLITQFEKEPTKIPAAQYPALICLCSSLIRHRFTSRSFINWLYLCHRLLLAATADHNAYHTLFLTLINTANRHDTRRAPEHHSYWSFALNHPKIFCSYLQCETIEGNTLFLKEFFEYGLKILETETPLPPWMDSWIDFFQQPQRLKSVCQQIKASAAYHILFKLIKAALHKETAVWSICEKISEIDIDLNDKRAFSQSSQLLFEEDRAQLIPFLHLYITDDAPTINMLFTVLCNVLVVWTTDPRLENDLKSLIDQILLTVFLTSSTRHTQQEHFLRKSLNSLCYHHFLAYPPRLETSQRPAFIKKCVHQIQKLLMYDIVYPLSELIRDLNMLYLRFGGRVKEVLQMQCVDMIQQHHKTKQTPRPFIDMPIETVLGAQLGRLIGVLSSTQGAWDEGTLLQCIESLGHDIPPLSERSSYNSVEFLSALLLAIGDLYLEPNVTPSIELVGQIIRLYCHVLSNKLPNYYSDTQELVPAIFKKIFNTAHYRLLQAMRERTCIECFIYWLDQKNEPLWIRSWCKSQLLPTILVSEGSDAPIVLHLRSLLLNALRRDRVISMLKELATSASDRPLVVIDPLTGLSIACPKENIAASQLLNFTSDVLSAIHSPLS